MFLPTFPIYTLCVLCNSCPWLVWNEPVKLTLVLKRSERSHLKQPCPKLFSFMCPLFLSFLSTHYLPSALNHLLQIFSSELFSTLATGELKAGNPTATGSCYGISDRRNSRNASMMTKCSNCGEEGRMWERLLLNLPPGFGEIIYITTLSAVSESGKFLDTNGPEFKSLLHHLLAG